MDMVGVLYIDMDFSIFWRYFGQPLVILMSPQDVPTAFQGKFQASV